MCVNLCGFVIGSKWVVVIINIGVDCCIIFV